VPTLSELDIRDLNYIFAKLFQFAGYNPQGTLQDGSTLSEVIAYSADTLSVLASTALGQGASLVGINDSGMFGGATNVEDALAFLASSSGGGTVDQGAEGSAPGWYIQDGSGLLATIAKQDIGNASLTSIDGKVSTAALQNTGNSSLSSIDTKISTGNSSLNSIDTKVATAANQATEIASLSSIDSKVSTAAKQDTGNASLSSIDGKVSTAALQTTGNSSLSSITSNQTNGNQVSRILGLNLNNTTTNTVGISERSGLDVDLIGPLTAFGELQTAQPTPRVQIDGTYGILQTDVQTLTDGVSGTATAVGNLFSITTGATSGGYAVIRSRRIVRYRPGQGCRILFTALYSAGVANSLQLAGGFTAADGLFFGYNGTTFGIMRRIPGAVAIYRLTLTVGSGGAESVTVTLNGVPFVVVVGAASTTVLAQTLASSTTYTGWVSIVSPTANGATVTFIQNVPAATAGAFTFTSTGTAAGTFAQIQAGAANDNDTGFVAQTAWNVDRLDGSNGALNPSGMLLDPTKLNVFEIAYPYLGAGTIRFSVMTPSGMLVTVHQIRYPNSATATTMKNPALRPGWIAASLGSTTNLTVRGASAAGFVQGQQETMRDPNGISTVASVTNTEGAFLLIRSRAEFASVVNQRQVLPYNLGLTVETANRIVRARVVLNPTITGTINWTYVSQTTSSVEYAVPTAVTVSGGSAVAFAAAVTNTSLSLRDLDLRMEPGDVLAIALVTASSTATTGVSLNWQED